MSYSDHTYTVDSDHQGVRVDVFLAAVSGDTRSHIKKCIDHGRIDINAQPVTKAGHLVAAGDVILIRGESPEETAFQQQEDASLYRHIVVHTETPDYLVVTKPAGLLVHPTLAQERVTLTAWLVSNYPDIVGVGEHANRPGIVHRLDKEASGLLVIARTPLMHAHLKAQFKARTVKKEYTVLVYGHVSQEEGTIDFAIDRGAEGRMVARPKLNQLTLNTVQAIQPGKTARTDFRVIRHYGRFSLLSIRIHSGRTHQIRVHMYAIGHPVVGDTLYKQTKLIKRNDTPLSRLFLHATSLCFQDLDDTEQCFDAPLPEALTSYLDTLI